MRISDWSSDVCSSDLLARSGKGLDEQQLFDLGLNQIRPQLVTVHGVAMPFPSGGKQRQIQIDIDPDAMQARGLSAQEVAAALANQTQLNPADFDKMDNQDRKSGASGQVVLVQGDPGSRSIIQKKK